MNEFFSLSDILALNDTFKKDFASHKLFSFLEDPKNKDPILKEKFFSLFQVWSNSFQKMVLIRGSFCSDNNHQQIANLHMKEEFGHNINLQRGRGILQTVWDPILYATAEWFPWTILSLDESEKIILVHLVVEASASVFYQKIPAFISECPDNYTHFEIHKKVDEDHELLGLSLLESLSDSTYKKLSLIQRKGWSMLSQMFERIYILLKNESEKLS